MPNYDWNKNGKRDAFDSFIDTKVMSSISEDNDKYDTSMDVVNGNINNEINANTSKITGFQEELKKNMKTLEQVKKEDGESVRNLSMLKAEEALDDIKEMLLYKVRRAEYEIRNGVTYISCLYTGIDYRYMHQRICDNYNDQNFSYKKYKRWTLFEVNPKYKNEYNSFLTTLKKLASKENIFIEPVLVDKINGILPFPITLDKVYLMPRLSIKATTIISSNTNNIKIKTVEEEHRDEIINFE